MTPLLPPHNPPSATPVLTAIQGLGDVPAGTFTPHRLSLREGVPGSGTTTLAVPVVLHGGAGRRTRAGEETSRTRRRAAQGGRVRRCRLEEITVRALVPSEDARALRRGLPVFMMLGDTVEAIFARLPNHAILPSALRRLFRWLKDRGTAVIMTGEMGTTPA